MKAENLWRISGLALVVLVFAAVAFVLTHQVQSWSVEAEKSAPVQGEVVYNNASAGTSVIDGYADTGVSNGTLEYVGDGWWHVKGWRLVYVKPPANYSIAVVHVKSRAEVCAVSPLSARGEAAREHERVDLFQRNVRLYAHKRQRKGRSAIRQRGLWQNRRRRGNGFQGKPSFNDAGGGQGLDCGHFIRGALLQDRV